MVEIREDLGRLWQIDEQGYIINDAALEKIVPPFSRAVAEMRDAYLKHLPGQIHSIYLRGSVARGQGVPDVSDLDNFAVITADPDSLDLSWCEAAAVDILRRHPFITSLGFDLESYDSIVVTDNHFNELSLQLRTQAVCLWGQDLIPTLPRYKLDVVVANCDICQIKPDIEEAIFELMADSSPQVTRYWCRRIMKNILRAGFSLVMLEERAYTRDLYPCYKLFARYYPEKESAMRHALELALQPSASAAEVLLFLNTFGPWLIATADHWLDRYNPSRELALKII
jgi:predicted nucleotidyltransferase